MKSRTACSTEVCALEFGRPSFSAMQQGRPGTPIVYEAFDLLELEGESLVALPLSERRRKLDALLDRRNRTVRLSEAFDDGAALYDAAQAQGLEGIVAKRADSPYREGKRTREWLKIKTHGRQEFVIAGYTKGQGRRSGRFGSLSSASGGATSSSTPATSAPGSPTATSTSCSRSCGHSRPTGRRSTRFRRCPRSGRPTWSGSGRSWSPRSSSSSGRTTVGSAPRPSRGCARTSRRARFHREEPLPNEIRRGNRVVKLSNLDKVFWPDEGTTKGDLLRYYRAVAPVVIPHIRNRRSR